MNFVGQAYAASLLTHIQDDATPLCTDHLHRAMQLMSAVTAHGVKDIPRQALTVYADQG